MSTENPITQLAEAYEHSQAEVERLQESIDEVRAMMSYEDRGWTLLAGATGEKMYGLEIEDVKDIADKLAPRVAGGALPKRAVDLHSGFVWGQGCFIDGTEKSKTAGQPRAERRVFTNPANQESIFSDSARQELQKERFITGNVLVAVNRSSRTANRIPFQQIIAVRTDPEFPENITAYLREWDRGDGSTDPLERRWYVTKRWDGKRPQRMRQRATDKSYPVSQDSVIVDLRVNRQVGHVLGVPDGLAGFLWSETYGRVLNYGETVQEALANILFTVTSATKKGVQSTGVKISSYDGHGGTASMMQGQELNAVSTAGRGYDYASAQPLASMAAAAWNVATPDLLNSSAAAGSSYGAASALASGNRNAMLTMQKQWAGFYKDVFEAMGLDRPTVVFEPFETPDKYREMQALTLGAPDLHRTERRMKTLEILDIVGDKDDLPPVEVEPVATAAQTAAPDQGVSNGTGGGGQGANDQRTDTVSPQEMAREMRLEDLIVRMESAIRDLDNRSRD